MGTGKVIAVDTVVQAFVGSEIPRCFTLPYFYGEG